MPSKTATRCASANSASTEGSCGRRIAQSTPRVKVKPVSFWSTARSPVYTGISEPAMASACFTSGLASSNQRRSIKNDSAVRPASRARDITLGDSAMKMPFSGSSLFRSCRSVRLTYAATRSSAISLISTTFTRAPFAFAPCHDIPVSPECNGRRRFAASRLRDSED